MRQPTSKFKSYIDKHNQKRYSLRKYIIYLACLVVFVGVGKALNLGEYFRAPLEDLSIASVPWLSDMVDWYRSAAFVDENLFADYTGVFPDLDDIVRQEMAWLARMWGLWVGGIGLALPLVFFILFQVGKRAIDRKRPPPPSLDKNNLSVYQEIHQQVYQAYWRANNHNLEKSFFLVGLLGVFLFAIQFLLQPFVMLSHDLLISVLVSFMVYTAMVYFFYLYWQRFPHSRVIRIIDNEMDLRQSLSTALEVGDDYRSSSLYLYLLKETKEKLCKDNILRFFPRKFPRLNYRNIGTTTFFLGMTIFLVSISLPVMALVYNNIRSGLFSSRVERLPQKVVDNVILEESNRIRLLKNFLGEGKESPELESAAKALSDLSKRLDKIAMNEEEVGDIQALTMGMDKKLDKKWLMQGDENKEEEEEEEESSQQEDKTVQDKMTIAGQSLDLNLSLQIKSIIKDLIRYDLKKKRRDPASAKTNKTKRRYSPSKSSTKTTNISSLGAQSKSSSTNPLSIKKRKVLNLMKRDIKKLQKLTVKLTEIQKQVGKLARQMPDVKKKTGSPSDQKEYKRQSLKGELKQFDKLLPANQAQNKLSLDYEGSETLAKPDKQAKIEPSATDTLLEDSADPGAKGKALGGNNKGNTIASSEDRQNTQVTPDAEQEEETSSLKGQDRSKKDSQKTDIDNKSTQQAKQEEKVLQPNNIEFIREKIEDLGTSMGEWDYDWEEMADNAQNNGESFRFKERMRVNGLRLKQFSEKLISIVNPEGLVGISPDIARRTMKIENPDKIKGMLKIAKNREVITPDKAKELSAELRLIGNDLNYLASKVEENILGDPRYADLRNSLYNENPALSKQNNDQGLGSNTSTVNSQVNNAADSNRSQENLKLLPSASDGRPSEAETKLKGLSNSLPSRIPANVRPLDSRYLANFSGIDPDSSAIEVRGENDGKIKGVIDELKSLYAGAQDLDKIIPTGTSRTLNSRPALSSNNVFQRAEVLQRRLRQEQDPNNLKNLANNMALVAREIQNQGLGKTVPPKRPEVAAFKNPTLSLMVQDIDQIQDRMRSERNPDRLKSLSTELVQNIQKFQQQITRQKTPGKEVGSNLSGQQPMDPSSEQIMELVSRMRSEGNPGNLKDLSGEFIQQVQSYRQELRMAGVPPKNTSKTAQDNSRGTQLEQDLKGRISQMRRQKNPDNLRNSANQIAQRIQEFEGKDVRMNRKLDRQGMEANIALDGVRPSSPQLQQVSSLNGQILELASRMRHERNPGNLENLSAEFTRQIQSYREQLRNTGVPPGNMSGGAQYNRKLGRLERDLQDRTNQMRREQNPENLRNMADQTAQQVLEFEKQNLRQNKQLKAQDAQLNVSLDGARQDSAQLRQTASLDGKILELASRMRYEQNPGNLENLSAEFTRQVQSYREQLRNAGVPPGNMSDGAEYNRKLGRLERDLNDRTNQMRREQNPENLRNMADQTAQQVLEFEKQNASRNKQTQPPSPQMSLAMRRGQPNSSSRQQLSSLNGQIQDLASRMRSEQNPANLESLSVDLARQVQSYRKELRKAGTSPDNASKIAKDKDQLTRLKSDLKNKIDQMRQDRNPENLRNSGSQIAQRIQEYQRKNFPQDQLLQEQTSQMDTGGGSGADSFKQQRLATLSGQISQLSDRMRNDRNPRNLKNLSAEFTRQVESYRQQLRKAGVPPDSVSGGEYSRQRAQFDSDLKQRADQMRQDRNPENLRNSGSQIAQRIQEYQRKNFPQNQLLQEQASQMDTAEGEGRSDSFKQQRLATLSGQISQLSDRMRNDRNPRNLKNLSAEFTRQVESYRQELRKAGVPPDSVSGGEYSRQQAQFDSDLKQRTDQMRQGQNTDNIQKIADQTAQRIREFGNKNLKLNNQFQQQSIRQDLKVDGVMPNSPDRRLATSRSGQIMELASRMRSERSPRNLQSMNAEFIKQVRSYSQDIKRSGNTPTNSLEDGQDSSFLEQFEEKLRERTDQMRPGKNPKKLRNLADDIAKRIKEYEEQTQDNTDRQRERSQTSDDTASVDAQVSAMNPQNKFAGSSNNMLGVRENMPDRQQESLKDGRNYSSDRLGQSAGTLQNGSLGNQVDQIQQRQVNQQNARVGKSRTMTDRNLQLASLARDFQNISKQMQGSKRSENLENLKNDLLDRTRKFMDMALKENMSVKDLENRIKTSTERLRRERSPLKGKMIDGKQLIQNTPGQDSSTGVPPETASSKGNSISTLSWQMERLAGQLQNSIEPDQIKQLSQNMLEKAQQLKNQIKGNVPSGSVGQAQNTDLQTYQGLKDIQQVARQIQREDRQRNVKDLFNLLSKTTQEFSDQTIGKGDRLSALSDSRERVQLEEMNRDLKRLIDKMRNEKDLDRFRDLSKQVEQLTLQTQRNFLALGNPSFEIQEAAFSNQKTLSRSSDREIISDRERSKQNRKDRSDGLVSPVKMFQKESPGLSDADDNRQISQKSQQLARLNRQTDLLTKKLRQETDPKRIRELAKNSSRLADQIRALPLSSSQYRPQDLTEAPKKMGPNSKIKSRTGSFNSRQLRQLSRIEQNLSDLSRDIISPDANNDQRDIASNLKQQIDNFQKLNKQMTLADPEPQKALTFAVEKLQQLSAQMKSPSQNSKNISDELTRLSRKMRDQIRPLNNGQIPAGLKAKDDMFNEIRDLSRKVRSENTPKELRKLSDRLADSLSRAQEKFLGQSYPEKMDQASMSATKIPEDVRHVPAGGGLHDSMVDQLITEMDRVSNEMRSESDTKRLKQLGRKISDVSRKLLALKKSQAASTKKLFLQKSRKKAGLPQRMQNPENSNYKLMSDRRNIKSAMQRENRPTEQKSSGKNSLNNDPPDTNSTLLARQNRNPQESSGDIIKRETTLQDHDFDPTHMAMIDVGLQIQKVSDQIQREDDPKKLRKFQKQLVKMNSKMIKLMQENLTDNLPQLPESPPPGKNTEEFAELLKTLSLKLRNNADNTQQLDQISDRLDRLAEQIQPDNRRLAATQSENNPSLGGGKDGERGPERKSMAAIRMIDGTIQKLRAYGKSRNRTDDRMSETLEGGAERGLDGRKDRQLMIADRFEAHGIARDTNVIPDTGAIRNVLSMEKDLHQDDVLERIIKRLEMNKQRIERVVNGVEKRNVGRDNYSDTYESGQAAKQPTGLEGIRYSKEAGVVVDSSMKKAEEEEKFETKTTSSMKTERRFLNVQVKMDELINMDTIPTQKMQTKKDKAARLSTFQETADSVGEDTIPPKYQYILKRLFSDQEQDIKETGR